MAAYLISYDLRKEINSQDYTTLIEQIKSYGTWAKVLESTWIVVSQKSASEIRDELSRYMDSNDGLFVLKSGV